MDAAQSPAPTYSRTRADTLGALQLHTLATVAPRLHRVAPRDPRPQSFSAMRATKRLGVTVTAAMLRHAKDAATTSPEPAHADTAETGGGGALGGGSSRRHLFSVARSTVRAAASVDAWECAAAGATRRAAVFPRSPSATRR